jgi:uncharacterized protein
MSKTSFQTLNKIQYIQKKIEAINHQIEVEGNRILNIENQLNDRKLSNLKDKKELEEVNLSLKERESALLKNLRKITDAKNNQLNVVSEKQAKALEDEIASLEELKIKLEEQIFLALESQEKLAKNISDFESFHVGVLKTLEELKSEIKTQFQLENKELEDLKIRLDNLLTTLPIDYRDFYSSISKKFKSNSLAKIENGKCEVCKMSVPSSICQEVETGNILETCQSCGRMLIPHLD